MRPTGHPRSSRLPAFLVADGPDFVNLRKAGRAAIVAPAVLALGMFVFDDDSLATYAVFASVVGLVFADYGGPPRRRAGAYLTMILLGSGLIVVGAGLSALPVAAVAGMFVVAFTATFASSFGGYAPLHVAGAALAYSLSVLEPLGDLAVTDRVAGWVLGGTAALVAALVLWPVERRNGLTRAAIALMSDLAAVIEAADDPDLAATRLDSAAAGAADLQAGLASPLRPYGPAVRDISLVHLAEHLDHGVELARETVDAARDGHLDARLADEVATALRRAADVLAGEREPDVAVDELGALDRARAAGRARVDDEAASDSADPVGVMVASIPLLALSHLTLWVEYEAARATGRGAVAVPRLGTAAELTRGRGDGLRARLRRTAEYARWELDPEGVILRNSVRAGVSLATAVGLAEVLDVQHGFWIVLATLMVLRSSAASTSTSAMAAVLGTAAGFVVAALVAGVAAEWPVALWVLFPVVVAVAGFTPGAIGVGVGQAAFAVLVVVLFMIVDLPGLPTAAVRLETVTIGALTGVVLGLVMWPRGARAVLADVLAEVYRAAAEGTVTYVTGSDEQRLEAKKRSLGASRRAEAALGSALAEHGERIDLAAWVSVFQPLVLARSLLVGLVPAVVSPVAGCRAAMEHAEQESVLARDRLTSVAERLETVAARGPLGSGPEGRDLAGSHDESPLLPSRQLAACVSACAGERDRMADALALASWCTFLGELVAEVDRSDSALHSICSAGSDERWLIELLPARMRRRHHGPPGNR